MYFQSLNIAFMIANSATLIIWIFTVYQTILLGVPSIQRINSPLSDEFNQGMPLGPKVAPSVGHMFYIDLYRENKKYLFV